jgi:hypothetical protein
MLAAIGRLVHHVIVLAMNVESFRRGAVLDRGCGSERPRTRLILKEKALIAGPR